MLKIKVKNEKEMNDYINTKCVDEILDEYKENCKLTQEPGIHTCKKCYKINEIVFEGVE